MMIIRPNRTHPRSGWVFPAAAFTIFGAPAHAQVAPPAAKTVPAQLTLQDAIAIALHQQPQLYSARTQITQAQGQKQQAQSQYYPTLTPTYSFQNNSQTFYGVNSGAVSSVGVPINEVTTTRGGGLSINLAQTLYDGGQREAANAEARRQLDAAKFATSNTRQQIVFTVTQAYYNLLAAQDQVKVAQAQVSRFQQTVDLTQAQIQAGTTAAKDIYQSQADLATAQITLLQNQTTVKTDSTALKNAMGVESDSDLQPVSLSQGNALPPLPEAGKELTLDDYVNQAYANRPDLREEQATLQSQEAAVRAARLKAGFTVNGAYALTYQATNDVGYRGVDSQLLVSGSYPLFDAGNARGAVHIAEAQRDATKDSVEQTRQTIRSDVETAVANRASALQQTGLAQAAVKAAQVNYDAAVDSRKEGVGTVLDITTAQATLTQAQSQYVTAVYNYYIADAALQKAIGRNDPGTAAP